METLQTYIQAMEQYEKALQASVARDEEELKHLLSQLDECLHVKKLIAAGEPTSQGLAQHHGVSGSMMYIGGGYYVDMDQQQAINFISRCVQRLQHAVSQAEARLAKDRMRLYAPHNALVGPPNEEVFEVRESEEESNRLLLLAKDTPQPAQTLEEDLDNSNPDTDEWHEQLMARLEHLAELEEVEEEVSPQESTPPQPNHQRAPTEVEVLQNGNPPAAVTRKLADAHDCSVDHVEHQGGRDKQVRGPQQNAGSHLQAQPPSSSSRPPALKKGFLLGKRELSKGEGEGTALSASSAPGPSGPTTRAPASAPVSSLHDDKTELRNLVDHHHTPPETSRALVATAGPATEQDRGSYPGGDRATSVTETAPRRIPASGHDAASEPFTGVITERSRRGVMAEGEQAAEARSGGPPSDPSKKVSKFKQMMMQRT